MREGGELGLGIGFSTAVFIVADALRDHDDAVRRCRFNVFRM